mmetsp:Transcript_37432/g.92097  ORF Transcript_37432/g.92097 Transcript_37432/m.92097 type:complete len:110 (-) Transcript_37432:63-392(-)
MIMQRFKLLGRVNMGQAAGMTPLGDPRLFDSTRPNAFNAEREGFRGVYKPEQGVELGLLSVHFKGLTSPHVDDHLGEEHEQWNLLAQRLDALMSQNKLLGTRPRTRLRM